MFVLRVINKDGLETNEVLGRNYTFVNRETNYDEFQRVYKAIFNVDHIADLDEMSDNFSKKCYGIIHYNEGNGLIPLYKDQWNYIMTESGKTFDNLTFK